MIRTINFQDKKWLVLEQVKKNDGLSKEDIDIIKHRTGSTMVLRNGPLFFFIEDIPDLEIKET